jgi:hypothetical protein
MRHRGLLAVGVAFISALGVLVALAQPALAGDSVKQSPVGPRPARSVS